MSQRIVAAHQPNYLPWLGYFHKIMVADVFVFLDHVEYSRRSFINRNRIKGPKGATWLTVPVKVSGTMRIMDVPIDNGKDWRRKHVMTLKAFYGKAPYFDEVFSQIEDVYSRSWEKLADLNIELVRRISEMLDLKAEFVRSSELKPQGKKEEMIIDVCRKLGANVYFSGRGARNYQNEEDFEREGIKLVYQSFSYPEYPQRFGGFVPNLSVVDVLFNVGVEKTREMLKNSDLP